MAGITSGSLYVCLQFIPDCLGFHWINSLGFSPTSKTETDLIDLIASQDVYTDQLFLLLKKWNGVDISKY